MEILNRYFPNLEQKQVEQFKQFACVFIDWNEKINLISRKDIDSLFEKHILHSLAIAKFIQFKPGTKIMDVGTGGGFPGIPLAIMFPDSKFHLVDSIGKKIMVVNNIIQELNLKNCKGFHQRAETMEFKYDFIVSRAVTALPDFMKIVKNKIASISFNSRKNGVIFLKGGDLGEELKPFPKAYVKNISDYFAEEFFETKKIVFV